jgi:hypothetical protein
MALFPMTLSGRIGQFILFISVLALVVFFATVMAEEPYFIFCFAGLLGFALGALLVARGRVQEPPSGRFRVIRRGRDKLDDHHEKEGKMR